MLRTALKPQWLALLAVVLLGATVMSWLGQWQWDAARAKGAQAQSRAAAKAAAQPPRELTAVLRPRTTFEGKLTGARVRVRGTYELAQQVLVPDRRQGAATGLWVYTPLRLADGSAVGVVRGWVPTAGDPSIRVAPAGPVTVTGLLLPNEPLPARTPGQSWGVPEGQVPAVTVLPLLTQWQGPLFTGYLLAAQQEPATAGAPAPGEVQQVRSDLAWRNLSYAFQWWVFAAFGLFFWWRLVRDDYRGGLQGPSGKDLPAAPAETGTEQNGAS